MKIQKNDILILGAGPTGLMLANQLTRFGVDYIILDQKSGTTNESRALVVQARSLEIYQQLGLTDQIIAEGQANNGIEFYKNGNCSASVTIVDKDEKSSPFPVLMMYEQSKNENLLYNNLLSQAKTVHWNTNVNAIEKNDEGYIINAQQANENIIYQCKYLIACDGSKSIAREFAKEPFVGDTYLNVFYVADTHANAGISDQKLSLFLTQRSVAMLFPMKGEHHFRALGVLPKEYYNKNEIPFEEILTEAKKQMKMPVNFYDTNWHSTYKLHHKKVQKFNKDNIFFAGDAAHVHSPAGGQGMNTGLQDAYNLAWKLSLVQKGLSKPALLSTYHEERNPVAIQLLKTTDRLFAAMITDNIFFVFLRLFLVPNIVPLLASFKSIRKSLFQYISQIKINYLESSLSKGKAGKIRAGLRCPYFFVLRLNQLKSIYDIINENTTTPFTAITYNLTGIEKLNSNIFRQIILDVNENNAKAIKDIGLSKSFIMVLRPDNYITYISEKPDINELSDFLKKSYSLIDVDNG